MKSGTKIKIAIAVIGALPVILGFFVLLFLIGGGEYAADPVPPIATEEQAERYQYIGSELGVPWEITLLVDAIYAFQEGKPDISETNPLITALEFCIMTEQKYELQQSEDEEDTKEKWVESTAESYLGCDEILGYIEAEREDLEYTECSALVAKIQKKAKNKGNDHERYEILISGNTDYRGVLLQIGLREEEIDAALELNNAHYFAYKYGYLSVIDDELIADASDKYEKVEVVVGNVTRDELARVAVSLMNWPYLLGGKSFAAGVPNGPLDCSGYIDWVYIQCFGRSVSSGGRLPSGIPISGTAIQFYACDKISESDLKVGDLGFLKKPENVAAGGYNHVGIYLGEIDGQHAWAHCGGSSFGYGERPKGRMGISVSAGSNDRNPVTGGTFSPSMPGCRFQYFRRPRFQFKDDMEE